ncbi:hypothetical protein [uncultured Jatrophihabitans sp.]|uniref:hypothetical protein n=1 Tax=uncultured Jatrophihabitans sp. TaxID=1610747 RepID=UPI0035CAE491
MHRVGELIRVEIDDWATGSTPLERRQESRSAHLLNRLSARPDVHVEVVAADCSDAHGVTRVIVHDTLLPADIAAGDLLAVPGTGNDPHSALAHRIPRPALVAVSEGEAWPLTPRQHGQAARLHHDVG